MEEIEENLYVVNKKEGVYVVNKKKGFEAYSA